MTFLYYSKSHIYFNDFFCFNNVREWVSSSVNKS